ncbi:MAG: flagellar hook-length control protein FliK [Betaproteobacteria bacterium]
MALGGLRLVTTLPQPLEQAAAMLGDAPVPQKAPASDELALQQSLVLASGGALPALVGRGMVQAAGGVAVTGKPALSVAQVASASAPATAAAPSAAAAPATAAAVVAAASSVPLTAVEGARVSQVSWQVPSVAAPQPVVPVHELQPQGAAAAATAALSDVAPEALPEVMRLRLAPTEFITRRLAAMAGTGEQATWGSVAGESVAAVGLLRLDMRGLNLVGPSSPLAVPATQAVDALDPQADAQPALGAAHPSHEPGRPQALSPAASAPAPWVSTAAQRTEQYEQLAQRLGEALGQRLQSQLERGEWKVQMRLDPAHLGRIDLSLDMSAGGLDAVFRSDNQATRDLIAQGLPRLRESLSQSGTAVANVWVQGDSNRQTGGNPTPGRTPDPHDETASGRDAGSDEPLAAPAVARPRQGTSAWDVLA